VSRAIGYSINVSVGAEWTSLKLHGESLLNNRGGREPTFHLVEDDHSAMTDFYFGEITEILYNLNRQMIFGTLVLRCTADNDFANGEREFLLT